MSEQHEHHHAGAASGLTKKMGPLPVWAWGLILGIAGYLVYRHMASSSTSSSPTTQDPNAVDPNTGLTYGQEESAALQGAVPAESGLGGGVSGGGSVDTGTGGSGSDFADELGQFDQTLQAFGQAQSDFQSLFGGSPAPADMSGQASAATGVVSSASSSPPTTTASAHTQQTIFHQTTGILTQTQSILDSARHIIGKGPHFALARREADQAAHLLKQAAQEGNPFTARKLGAEARSHAAEARKHAAQARHSATGKRPGAPNPPKVTAKAPQKVTSSVKAPPKPKAPKPPVVHHHKKVVHPRKKKR